MSSVLSRLFRSANTQVDRRSVVIDIYLNLRVFNVMFLSNLYVNVRIELHSNFDYTSMNAIMIYYIVSKYNWLVHNVLSNCAHSCILLLRGNKRCIL